MRLKDAFLHSALAVVLLLVASSFLSSASAETAASRSDEIRVYFFWGNGCPHCTKEKEYLDSAVKRYPQIRLESYEVWQNPANARFFRQMTVSAGIKSTGVPVTFVGSHVYVGFSSHEEEGIEKSIRGCIENPCADPAERLRQPAEVIEQPVELPFIGRLDQSKASLPMITILLGLLDSFNPCAFFVLLSLLGLLVHAGSRGRMLMIGGTFVFFSGLLYFLFLSAWLNLFMLAGNLPIITIAAGCLGLIVAAINIKDFFFFKKGLSLSIPQGAKPKLFSRMRGLVASASVPSMLSGTIVLAIAANTYELLCTAGFPMVFTRILTLHALSPLIYYAYLILYCVIYIIPLLLIVAAFTVTLGSRKLTEWQGRKLKLISGFMMLSLGLILLVRPALLSSLSATAGIFIISVALSWLVIMVMQRGGFGEGTSA